MGVSVAGILGGGGGLGVVGSKGWWGPGGLGSVVVYGVVDSRE